jgi:hypothetical protein
MSLSTMISSPNKHITTNVRTIHVSINVSFFIKKVDKENGMTEETRLGKLMKKK